MSMLRKKLKKMLTLNSNSGIIKEWDGDEAAKMKMK